MRQARGMTSRRLRIGSEVLKKFWSAPDDAAWATLNRKQGKMVLEAIRYKRGSLQILNQLLLPHATEFDEVRSSEDAWHAIKSMRTRGAPAIAIVAALGLAIELSAASVTGTATELSQTVHDRLDYLVTSRPTAVNLADAARKLKAVVDAVASSQGDSKEGGEAVREAYLLAAEKMLVDDVQDNEAIGKNGARWIQENSKYGREERASVLTHCNTGQVNCPFLQSHKVETDNSQVLGNSRIWYCSWCDSIATFCWLIATCLLHRNPSIQSRLETNGV